MSFAEVERKLARLRQELVADRLTEEQFKARSRELMVQDEQGRWWMAGLKSGEWYLHDGSDWVRADPPSYVPSESPRYPPRSTAWTWRRMPKWVWVLALLLLLALLLWGSCCAINSLLGSGYMY